MVHFCHIDNKLSQSHCRKHFSVIKTSLKTSLIKQLLYTRHDATSLSYTDLIQF